MTQKFYVDALGNFIGSWDVPDTVVYSEPDNNGEVKEISRKQFKPQGGIEVPSAPKDTTQKWNNATKTWGAKPAPEATKEDKLLATLKVALPLVFTDAKISEIKGA